MPHLRSKSCQEVIHQIHYKKSLHTKMSSLPLHSFKSSFMKSLHKNPSVAFIARRHTSSKTYTFSSKRLGESPLLTEFKRVGGQLPVFFAIISTVLLWPFAPKYLSKKANNVPRVN